MIWAIVSRPGDVFQWIGIATVLVLVSIAAWKVSRFFRPKSS